MSGEGSAESVPMVKDELYNREETDWVELSRIARRLARRCVADPVEAEELAQHAVVQLFIQIAADGRTDRQTDRQSKTRATPHRSFVTPLPG